MIIYQKKIERKYIKMLSLFLEGRSTGDEFLPCASIYFSNSAQCPYITIITIKWFLNFFNCKK